MVFSYLMLAEFAIVRTDENILNLRFHSVQSTLPVIRSYFWGVFDVIDI